MKNKNVGYLIVGISVIVFAIIFIFNTALKETLGATCTMGPTCGMYKTLSLQTWITIVIATIILLIGLFLIFAKEPEKIIFKKEPRKKINLDGLDKSEKKVVELIQKENGAMFQSTLMETLGIGKVGMTRMLDKLEAKQIIERKRRGMNNIVVLRQ